jgi:hypothetical protein
MKRREFITLLGSAAAAWPLSARAQQPERMRRIGMLLPAAADDSQFQSGVGAFLQGLALLGWTIGRNVRIDTRWATPNAADIRRHAAELVALAPDVILAHGASTVSPLLQATRSVPIVFPVVGDPVGAGIVDSLARPGGNATGFMTCQCRRRASIERGDRIPLGRGSNGPASGAGGRTGWPKGRFDRCNWRFPLGVRGQGGNHNDPDRLRCRRRPGEAGSRRQPRPARQEHDGDQFRQ